MIGTLTGKALEPKTKLLEEQLFRTEPKLLLRCIVCRGRWGSFTAVGRGGMVVDLVVTATGDIAAK